MALFDNVGYGSCVDAFPVKCDKACDEVAKPLQYDRIVKQVQDKGINGCLYKT